MITGRFPFFFVGNLHFSQFQPSNHGDSCTTLYVLGIVRIRGLGSEVVHHYSSLQSHEKRVQNVFFFPIWSNLCLFFKYIPKVFKRERFSCFETVKVCFEAMGRTYFRGRILQHLKRKRMDWRGNGKSTIYRWCSPPFIGDLITGGYLKMVLTF